MGSARAVDEGLLISRSTVTLAAKNFIVVGTLRDDRTLRDLDVAAFVARELRRLAAEQAEYARRTEHDATAAARAVGALRHQHDYRPADVVQLGERALIYAGLAAELDRESNDDDAIAQIAEAARAAAWTELSGVIEEHLDVQARASFDPAYLQARRRSMAAVREVDLPTLEPDYSRWA